MNENKKKLCQLLVDYSIELKKDEKVLIENFDAPNSFIALLTEEIFKKGGVPFVINHSYKIDRVIFKNLNQNSALERQKHKLNLMKDMDAYISIRAKINNFNLSDIPQEQLELEKKYFSKEILRQRVNHTKWVILNYPTDAFAQSAGMSNQAFEEYFFKVCNYDWKENLTNLQKLKNLMDKTDKVKIVGPGTDLSFSIKGINSVVCAGKNNIPDGEVFTAPIKDSVNGIITYNIPSVYDGKRFDNVMFVIKNGKIVEASSSNTTELNKILDADIGARYFGEFALGVNPMVTIPMLDILFDEKMDGSFHLTPGEAYQEADNGNRSTIHWDLVCNQTKQYGGGEIYFDGKLIRKNGIFVFW